MPPPPPPLGGGGGPAVVLRAPSPDVALLLLLRRRRRAHPGLLLARLRVRARLEPGCDEGNSDFALREFDGRVHHGAEDDKRARVHELVNNLRGFVDFVKRQVLASRDVPHDPGGAVDAEVQEGRGNSSRGGFARAVLTSGAADS